jgi:hypothetical protein
MRIGALILGIIGGIIGIFVSAIAILATSVAGAFVTEDVGIVQAFGFGYGLIVLALAVVGIVGGALALKKPIPATICMAVAAVGGFFTFGKFAAVLLAAGAALAYFGKKELEQTQQPPAAPIPPAV